MAVGISFITSYSDIIGFSFLQSTDGHSFVLYLQRFLIAEIPLGRIADLITGIALCRLKLHLDLSA